MTSFQDARDEHFQDVERNKVCSIQTKGEPHNLDFTIGNGIIPITCE